MVGLDFKILNLSYARLSILDSNLMQPDRRLPLVVCAWSVDLVYVLGMCVTGQCFV